ncbi:MAG: hypothetical protein JNJ45_00415 [Chthonomonas sp.]|nr:hypothetical protein [Chthonomonas sp.]
MKQVALAASVIAVVGGIGVLKFRASSELPEGMLVPEEPRQTATIAKPFFSGRYRITPLFNYRIRARVLSVKPYPREDDSDLMPIDLALGWGPMSNSKVIRDFRISQDVRHVFVSPLNQDALPYEVVGSKLANVHCCPDREWIADELAAIQPNTIVTLEGWLIRATRNDGFQVTSSISRDDNKGGACEILWVRKVTR